MLTLRKIFFNTASNYVRFFFDILIWFFLTPFVISCLGKNDFGILTLINSLLGAIGLLNMGIGTGVVKYVAGAVNQGVRETNRIVSTFLGIYLFLSLVAFVIMLSGCFFIGDFFSIPAERNVLFLQVFWIMGCRMVILYLPLHLFHGILYGRQYIALVNMMKLVSELFYAGFCWLLLSAGNGLLALAILGLTLMLFEHFIYIFACYRIIPGLRVSLSYFDRAFFREALPFSLHAFVINISNFVLLKSDPIMVKMFFPLSSVSVYGIALKLSESSLLMFKQFINVLTPVVAEMHGSGDQSGVARVFLKGARYAIMPAMLLWIGFMVHGESFLVWWLGESFRESAPILLILSGAVVLIMPQLSASNALAMSGRHQIVSKASFIALLLNVGASLCFLHFWGIIGVAWGSLFAVLVVDIGFILRRALQEFSVSVLHFSREVFLPVVVAGILTYLSLFALAEKFPVNNFGGIILVSLPGVLVFFLVCACFLQNEEWIIIRNGWQRIWQLSFWRPNKKEDILSQNIETLNQEQEQEERKGEEKIEKDKKTDVEKMFVEILQILSSFPGLEKITGEDNFFAAGLDSLRAIQLRNTLQRRFGRQLSLALLYQNPSVSQLCVVLLQSPLIEKTSSLSRGAGEFEISPMQLTFYMQDKLNDRPVSNINLVFRVCGPVDTGLLQKTTSLLVRRHESLRTVFKQHSGLVVQRVLEDLQPDFHFEKTDDFSLKSLSSVDAPWNCQPFSLESGPLFRVWQKRMEDCDYLIFSIHHIVFDGWSCAVFVRDFNIIYNGLAAGEDLHLLPLSTNFQDYVLRQETDKKSAQWLENKLYWKKKLAGFIDNIVLPLDFPLSKSSIFRAENYSFSLSRAQRELLYGFAARNRSTPFAVLLSIFKIWLWRLGAKSDICVGTAVANRGGDSEYEKITGAFVNALPLRTEFSGQETNTDFVALVTQTVQEALSRQDYPFEKILEDSGKSGFRNHFSPFFQTMLVYHSYQQAPLRVLDYKTEYIPLYRLVTEHYFTFYAEDNAEGGIGINVEYAATLLRSATMEKWSKQFLGLFNDFLAAENKPLAELLLLSQTKLSVSSSSLPQKELSVPSSSLPQTELSASSLPQTELEKSCFYSNKDIVDLLAESCLNHAQKTAAYDSVSNQELSYGELWRKSGEYMAALQVLGVQRGSLIAFYLQPGIQPLCLLLAILRCGAAWLPLDLKSPPDRIKNILQQSGTNFLLAPERPNEENLEKPPVFIAVADFFQQEKEQIESLKQTLPKIENPVFEPTDVAYVIYTSGSTGAPKGVEISRRALCAFAGNAAELYGFKEYDQVLQFASWSFDACIEEIFPTLMLGGKLVIYPNSQLQCIHAFFSFIREQQISVLDLPTALWHSIVNMMEQENLLLPESIRTVIIGGEAASALLWKKWHALVSPSVKIFNTYGPTEATVVATVFCGDLVTVDSTVPIGLPLPHVIALVLDEQGRELGFGQEGELCLGGLGLANGYRYDEKRSAEAFIEHPLSGERLYRTGDLVVKNADGNLIYKARLDRQVKLRGFRIDCIEVENAILQCSGVKKVAVNLFDEQLIAAFTGSTKPDDIRQYLHQILPVYMHPVLYKVDEIPLNSSGKVDFKALFAKLRASDLGKEQQKNGITENLSFSESLVRDIWQDVLQKKDLHPEDNFFDIGGNSLLALQLIHGLSSAGFKVGIQEIFLHPSIRQLTSVLQMNMVHASEDDHLPCIVHLCSGAEKSVKKPLFLMHSIPGDVLGYTDLVQALGSERPCYGVQSSGIMTQSFILEDIRKMSVVYADQILSFYDGPLLVAGWCYGGILALELANEFLRRGKKVDFVGIMELNLPETISKNLQRQLLRIWQLFSSGPLAWWDLLQLHFFYRGLFRGKESSIYSLEYDGGFLKNRSRIAEANLNSLRDYKITEFPPELTLFFGESYLRKPDYEWRLFTKTKTYVFQASHRSILRKPEVKGLADKIKQILDSVE